MPPIPVYQDLSCSDTLILTDEETHTGPANVHVYQRADGQYLLCQYFEGRETFRFYIEDLSEVRSLDKYGKMRKARPVTKTDWNSVPR